MREVLVVCGHGYSDPGALENRANGTNERDFTRYVLKPEIEKWAKQLKNSRLTFYDISKDLFQDTANGWGLYNISANQYDVIVEIHLDAASPSATGGHVIINSGLNADSVDLKLGQAIKTVVGWWGGVTNTQGIKGRDNLLNCNVSAKRGLNYRLIEIGFITNTNDMTKIRNNLSYYAKLITEAIAEEKIGGTVEVKPNAPAEEKKKKKGVITMVCTYQYEGSNAIYYFDGKNVTILAHPDEWEVLKKIYKANNGDDLPHFKWSKKAPYNVRLEAMAQRAVLPNKKA